MLRLEYKNRSAFVFAVAVANSLKVDNTSGGISTEDKKLNTLCTQTNLFSTILHADKIIIDNSYNKINAMCPICLIYPYV